MRLSSVLKKGRKATIESRMKLRLWLLQEAGLDERIVDKVLGTLVSEDVFDLHDLNMLRNLPRFAELFTALTREKISNALDNHSLPRSPSRPDNGPPAWLAEADKLLFSSYDVEIGEGEASVTSVATTGVSDNAGATAGATSATSTATTEGKSVATAFASSSSAWLASMEARVRRRRMKMVTASPDAPAPAAELRAESSIESKPDIKSNSHVRNAQFQWVEEQLTSSGPQIDAELDEEFEEPDEARNRRLAWIEYFVCKGRFQLAWDLGWDGKPFMNAALYREQQAATQVTASGSAASKEAEARLCDKPEGSASVESLPASLWSGGPQT